MNKSSQTIQRSELYNRFIDATSYVAERLPKDAFEPEIVPVIRELGSIAGKMFLADIDDEGLVTIPDEFIGTDDFAVVPYLNAHERLQVTPSFLVPDQSRVIVEAQAAGITAEVLSGRISEYISHLTEIGWSAEISAGENTLASVIGYSGEGTFDGSSISYTGKQILYLSQKLLEQPPVVQGIAGVHEATHLIDEHNANPATGMTIAERILKSTTIELRGSHVGSKAAQSLKTELNSSTTRDNIEHIFGAQEAVETARIRHGSLTMPFGVTPRILSHIVRYNRWGITSSSV